MAKCLGHNPSDTFGLGSKRTEMEDGPTSAEICSFLSKVPSCNASNSDKMKRPKEQQIFDWTEHLPRCCQRKCSTGFKDDAIRPLDTAGSSCEYRCTGNVSLTDNFESYRTLVLNLQSSRCTMLWIETSLRLMDVEHYLSWVVAYLQDYISRFLVD
ncbi:unnamed protein product, partial [Musa textilis]